MLGTLENDWTDEGAPPARSTPLSVRECLLGKER
jgi:hypothetical protein